LQCFDASLRLYRVLIWSAVLITKAAILHAVRVAEDQLRFFILQAVQWSMMRPNNSSCEQNDLPRL
jgi:hypothetical protein